MIKFRFGKRSENELKGVKPDMQRLCVRALELTPVDFGIGEGLRSADRQATLYDEGYSQTLNSKHLTGEAIDFKPYWKGFVLDWPYIFPVANAFMQASKDLNIQISWGGAWGMDMWAFRNVIDAQEAYLVLRAEREGKPFFDGYHIELIKPVIGVDQGESVAA